MTSWFIINHLWQSSCFTLLAGLLAFALRRNSPRVRYWVWLSASLKFVMPFGVLVSLGSMVPRPDPHPVSVAAPVLPNTLVQIVEPFSPALKAAVPVHAPLDWAPVGIGVVWALVFLAITVARCRNWLCVRAALRSGQPIELPIPLRALITPGGQEPGIVGFLRPILVLPAQLLEHLNPRQLGAILTHEMCHVRCRDNFFAAVHMAVEAIFWFHPLVWWIGSRMVEERELACDEEVLRMGWEPADYVQGILKVCRFYTESPLPCISGVTGADIKKRLRAILAGNIAHELSGGKKVTLAMIGLAALLAPIAVGILNAPFLRAQVPHPAYELASIKPNNSGDGHSGFDDYQGRIIFTNMSLQHLIELAYGMMPFQVSGPAWLTSEHFDIVAKYPDDATAPSGNSPVTGYEKALGWRRPGRNLMLRTLLEDRFRLSVHRETKQGSGYAVVAAKSGFKLKPSEPGDKPITQQTQQSGGRIKTLIAKKTSLAMLANLLTLYMGHTVVDRTGIDGVFDFELRWSTDEAAAEARGGDLPPSIFTALEESLGLRLQPEKVPVELIVVDHVDHRPAEN